MMALYGSYDAWKLATPWDDEEEEEDGMQIDHKRMVYGIEGFLYQHMDSRGGSVIISHVGTRELADAEYVRQLWNFDGPKEEPTDDWRTLAAQDFVAQVTIQFADAKPQPGELHWQYCEWPEQTPFWFGGERETGLTYLQEQQGWPYANILVAWPYSPVDVADFEVARKFAPVEDPSQLEEVRLDDDAYGLIWVRAGQDVK